MLRQAVENTSKQWRLGRRYSLYGIIMLLTVAALFALSIRSAQAQGGCHYFFTADVADGNVIPNEDLYFSFPESNVLTEATHSWIDPDCTIEDPTNIMGPWGINDGLVLADDADTASKLCESINKNPIDEVKLYAWASNIFTCVAGELVQRSGSGSGSGGSGYSKEPPQLPWTGHRLHAFDGMGSGIQFRRLSNYGVGDQSVIDMGFLDAVDIWSNIGSGYEVCFPQPGRIVFLDAATSPRSLVFPDYRFDDSLDLTCASMDRAGTMVLVNAPASAEAQPSTTAKQPGTDDPISSAIPLDNCKVRPGYNLRLRAAPWGRVLDVVLRGTEVAAKARTKSWFNVIYLDKEGWIAAWLTASEGDCD